MSAPEDRLVTLLERFRFPAPWAAVQEAKKEYDQACVDRGAAQQLGRATFSNDGTGPTRLNLFEQDAEDKWRRFQSLWQPVEELCCLLRERGLFGELGTPPQAPGDPYTPRERAEKASRILDWVRREPRATSSEPEKGLTEAEFMARVEAAAGSTSTAKICAIAGDATLDTDQKQRLIHRLDETAPHWSGERWHTLLGVSAAMARKTDWWKENHPPSGPGE